VFAGIESPWCVEPYPPLDVKHPTALNLNSPHEASQVVLNFAGKHSDSDRSRDQAI